MVAFGKYRVEAKRGAQGSWIVYDVVEVAQERKAELRVYSNRLPEGSEREKLFLDTLMAIAEVDHPHVINILDLGVAMEKGYYTCPPRQAISLTEAFAERELDILDPSQSLEAAIQLCEGVEALHEKGLVHGALCADTVAWDTRRMFPFLSWIPILDRSPDELRIQAPPLPPGYEGKTADLYGLAGLVHHLLIGTGPLTGSEIESHTAAVNVPGAMEGVYEALEPALAQDPSQGLTSASDLTAAIQKILTKQRVRDELEKSVSSMAIPQEVLEKALQKKKEQKRRKQAKDGISPAEMPYASPFANLPMGKLAGFGALLGLMMLAYPLMGPGTGEYSGGGGPRKPPPKRPPPGRNRPPPRATKKPTAEASKKPEKPGKVSIESLKGASPTSEKDFLGRWKTLKSWVLSLPPARRRNLFTYGKLVRLRGKFKRDAFEACKELDTLIQQAVAELD